jgi:hypothetical protein
VGRVELCYGTQRGCVWLRELRGYDEQKVNGTDTATVLALLEGLIEPRLETGAKADRALLLTAADRDRLLAHIYVLTYGPHVDSTAKCKCCGERFDLDFSLPALLSDLSEQPAGPYRLEADGTCQLEEGRRFRLPTGQDELAVGDYQGRIAGQALLQRCMVEGDLGEGTATVEEAMDQVAPLVSLDIDGVCPQCGHGQQFSFDIQSYLLSALLQERHRLYHEIHMLARGYGWGLTEILSLPRTQRRTFVALLENETF